MSRQLSWSDRVDRYAQQYPGMTMPVAAQQLYNEILANQRDDRGETWWQDAISQYTKRHPRTNAAEAAEFRMGSCTSAERAI